MSAEQVRGTSGEWEETPGPLVGDGVEEGPVRAWEQVENGRYMPRRIRGSFRGRELG